ncbi:MAG: DegT/DnrJ/EryC1/StrS family aminotransferase [Candidatus Latescibacteria bacterium]|nr:DegT/DnrJ/EryC1/StrS family aminotransferase [Candidatus Latescibacterota bacterium]
MNNKRISPFADPIYITRPLLPDLNSLQEKLKEVWDSQWLTNQGKQHQLLEEKIKDFLEIPYVSLFNNGTIALMAAVKSLRLAGEIITTPFTFPATPHILSWNNINPIFCDIDPTTMNIDANKIESMITPQTQGILAVHVFGTPCDVYKIQEVADNYGLKVIYDAAHAFGVKIDDIGIGNFGDISMFSFHATKLFHTAEGGALTFKDKCLKSRIDYLKNFGIKNEEEVVMFGINGKMNEIQAVLGLKVLELVEEEQKKREVLFDTYAENLKGVAGITLPKKGKHNSFQYFVIRIDKKKFGCSRDDIHNKFKNYNIFTRKYFYPLCSDYTCYKHLHYSNPVYLPVAHNIVKEVLCLPFYGRLTISDINKICDILKTFRHE